MLSYAAVLIDKGWQHCFDSLKTTAEQALRHEGMPVVETHCLNIYHSDILQWYLRMKIASIIIADNASV